MGEKISAVQGHRQVRALWNMAAGMPALWLWQACRPVIRVLFGHGMPLARQAK